MGANCKIWIKTSFAPIKFGDVCIRGFGFSWLLKGGNSAQNWLMFQPSQNTEGICTWASVSK